MDLNFKEFLKSESRPPIIFLFGEEDYLVENALFELINKYSDPVNGDYNTDIFDAKDKEVELDKIVDISISLPFASEYRLIIVKNIEAFFPPQLKKFDKFKYFENYINNPNPSTTLIITGNKKELKNVSHQNGKKSPKLKSVKFPFINFIENYIWFEFPKLQNRGLKNWITGKFADRDMDIDEDAAELLLAVSGESLREINNEVDKITVALEGREKITVDDINFISGASRQYNVFELQSAVGERLLKKSLIILNKILSVDKKEILIITLLTRYFFALLKLKEVNPSSDKYQTAQEIGVSPYFLQEYIRSSRNYSDSMIHNAIISIRKADKTLKTSSISSLITMENMLIEVIGSND